MPAPGRRRRRCPRRLRAERPCARAGRKGRAKGKRPKPPEGTPRGEEQSNLSDPDSRLMRKSKRHEYRQAYNAQAVVDAGGSQLIVGARVTHLRQRPQRVGGGRRGDRGRGGPAGDGSGGQRLCHRCGGGGARSARHRGSGGDGFGGPSAAPRLPPDQSRDGGEGSPGSRGCGTMADKLDSEEGRALYRLRRQTVEPVFGVIKAVLGFTRFSLRGLDKVAGEWDLVALAYNCKRLHKLTLSMAS